MVDSQRDSGRTGEKMTRRTALKGVASLGFAGTALSGTASAGGSSEITFRAASNATFTFQLIVTGRVKVDGGVAGVVAESNLQVAGSVVQGTVDDGEARTFRFTGEISVLQVSGRGTVLLNGEVIRDTTGDGDGGEQRLPKEVIVSSPDTDELLEYQFRVTGDLEKLEPNEDSGNAVDEVIDLGDRGTRVRGAVSTGDDRFAFSGRLIREEIPPEVKLEIRNR